MVYNWWPGSQREAEKSGSTVAPFAPLLYLSLPCTFMPLYTLSLQKSLASGSRQHRLPVTLYTILEEMAVAGSSTRVFSHVRVGTGNSLYTLPKHSS